MWKIYKALRDAEYMASEGLERDSIPRAIFEAARFVWLLRRECIEGTHIRLDVWDNRCWHERLNDKIERLEAKRVWGNPDITWTPQDELDYEAASRGIDYHPWRQ